MSTSIAHAPDLTVATPVQWAPQPALVHDYLLVLRGAERTFAALAAAWPDSPIFTTLYDDALDGVFGGRMVQTSFLQRLPVRQHGFRALLPAFPAAVRNLRTLGFPLVVSSSSAFALGVPSAEGAVHVCYCHSPFRYVWHERRRALSEVPGPLRLPLDLTLDWLRHRDLQAASGVTHFVANSEITRERIREFYGREALLVHPPVEIGRFRPAVPEDFFLIVGEIVMHKGAELALQAARAAGVALHVVGDGPERVRLEALYGDTATFHGRVDDETLASLYARARAVIVPNVEEFGIVAVEAQAAGRPVVAAGAGGALETVVAGETGVFFMPGDADELAQVLRDTDFERFAPEAATANAQRFSVERFQMRMLNIVAAAWASR